MLSIFPIHFLSLLAYFILRVCVGTVFIYLGYLHLHHRYELKEVLTKRWWPFGGFSLTLLIAFELILGTMIMAGYIMQLATLIMALLSLKIFILRHLIDHESVPSRLFYFLLFGACLALTITGAGAFAFDLPL